MEQGGMERAYEEQQADGHPLAQPHLHGRFNRFSEVASC